MAIHSQLQYTHVDDLFLDPLNPRLGRHDMHRDTPQDELLRLMSSWVLDELAWSYLESGGFWSYEPVMVVREELYGHSSLVVVEGNRRIAALKTLQNSQAGNPPSKKWGRMIDGREISDSLFGQVPYLLADSRNDVRSFLGFRHVTGIKQWKGEEKAEFIASLIDSSEDSFKTVARKIGSKGSTVRQHYVAYKILLQMEDQLDNFNPDLVGNRFSPLYMSLTTSGAQDYLGLSLDEVSERCPKIVEDRERLASFYRWLFVPVEGHRPLVKDTRDISAFGRILESESSRTYLETVKAPSFEIALQMSGDREEEIIQHLRDASHEIRVVLSSIHTLKKSEPVQNAVRQLGEDALQLLSIFPAVRSDLQEED